MANWEEIRGEWETSKITLAAIADKHGVKLGTLKSRKSREKWSRDPAKKDATIEKDATQKAKRMQPKKKRAKQKNRSGNPSPDNQFTKRNSASLKHGFFSKYIPEETLEIMGMLNKEEPADLIWDQIQIQYAAIIRAQEIMFVEDKDEIIKEVKKEKEFSSESGGGSETEWEFQFAWDRQASFLNAQSRAIAELRSSIKQFLEMAHDDDERRLKLELMQANIDKSNAEAERISKEQGGGAPPIINIVDEWSDPDE